MRWWVGSVVPFMLACIRSMLQYQAGMKSTCSNRVNSIRRICDSASIPERVCMASLRFQYEIVGGRRSSNISVQRGIFMNAFLSTNASRHLAAAIKFVFKKVSFGRLGGRHCSVSRLLRAFWESVEIRECISMYAFETVEDVDHSHVGKHPFLILRT